MSCNSDDFIIVDYQLSGGACKVGPYDRYKWSYNPYKNCQK